MPNATCQHHTPPTCLVHRASLTAHGLRLASVATSLQVWPSRSLNVARVRVMLCCFVLTCCSAAFQVESQHLQGQDDPRRIVGEVTRGPTFVFPGKYSVKFSMALQMSQPSLIELIMKNITDAVMDGFKTMLPARNGPVFAVPTGMETTPVQTGTSSVDGYLLVESSAFLVSFNTTSPANFDLGAWTNHTINFFRSKAASFEIRQLLSTATFTVRCGPVAHEPSMPLN